MNYKFGTSITIVGLILALAVYPIAPTITYFFGFYMLGFAGFLYFTEIRKKPQKLNEIKEKMIDQV